MKHSDLTRAQFERWFDNRSVALVVMEAWLRPTGHDSSLRAGSPLRLLPAAYVRAMCGATRRMLPMPPALLEATLWLSPVAVKSVEQQALQGLHHPSLWMSHRTSRINALRGLSGDFGLAVSVGARLGWSRSRACWPGSHQSRR